MISTPDKKKQSMLLDCTFDLLSKLRDDSKLTAALAVFDQSKVEGIVLESCPGSTNHSYVPRVGFNFPLHSTAPGKTLLAYVPLEERMEILDRLSYQKFTDKTFMDAESLNKALKEYRDLGYIPDVGEFVDSVNCVGACILDEKELPLAAVWITALAIELPVDEIPKMSKVLLRAVKEMQMRILNASVSQSDLLDIQIIKGEEYIKENFLDKNVVEEYLDIAGISDSWFRKKFREKFGVAPSTYRRKLLHDTAKRLLLKTNLSVKEISSQLCFETQNYFSRAFKRDEGVSPENYRKLMGSDS
jgi:DNA-binding IclR family transcriptional regulator/AraC-like DNA-binding protein